MLRHLWTAVRMLIVLTILTAGIYGAAVTGVAQAVFPYQANGSLVRYQGHVIGSALVGQAFTSPKFFDSRPSATSPPYNAEASTASNYGPTNPALIQEVKTNLQTFLKSNPGVRPGQVPPAMVESSDSGLDPDITLTAAYLQAPRVARENGLSLSTVRHLIAVSARGRFLGLYGNPYVNVLKLNLALLRDVKGHRP